MRAIAVVWIALFELIFGSATRPDDFKVAFLAIFVGYVSALVLGMPVFLILHRYRVTSFSAYLVSGLVLGLVVYDSFFPGLFSVVRAFIEGRTPDVWFYLGFIWREGEPAAAIAGAASAAVFWLIARPDREGEELN